MSETRKYSLLIGGLPHAADMPGLAHQVVPHPAEIEQAAKNILGSPVSITGGQADPETPLWFDRSSDPNPTNARRYSVETATDINVAELYSALVRAVLDVARLPPGWASECTVIVALDDEAGQRLARSIVEIPRGGGRRRFLSSSGMSGIALGGLAGAAVAGPVGAAVGMVIGGAAGEALEWLYPSDSQNGIKPQTP